MNKQNKILLGVLALIVACTIGYALFSESITISGTASASGEFDIELTCQSGLTPEQRAGLIAAIPEYADVLPTEAGFSNDSCTIVDDVVTLHADLAYPTAARIFVIKHTNNGTIPAELEGGYHSVSLCEYNKETNAQVSCVSNNSFIGLEAAMLQLENNTMYYGLEEDYEEKFINPVSDNQIIESGESIYEVYVVKWPEDKNSLDNYYSSTMTKEHNWVQSTE